MIVVPQGDAAVVITCAAHPGEAASARVHAMAAAVRAAALPGVVALVPGYTTLVVHFDPRVSRTAPLADAIAALVPVPAPSARRRWHIPVAYDGEDLAEVAAHAGLPTEQVVALHSAAVYTVACLGFAPGFAYLTGLPAQLQTPRRSSPRPRIAAGSLILGGQQTAIMPMAMPSGWHILGHTHVQLFDVTRMAPCLLLPGDRVQFVPTVAEALADRVARCEVGP